MSFKTILIAGVRSQPFGNWPIVSQSDDGVTWDEPTTPFDTKDSPTAIAHDGYTAAVSNARGYVAVTNDLVNWSTFPVSDGFGITSMAYSTGDWIAVGQRWYRDAHGPYDANVEVAQIHRSPDSRTWEMVWSHPDQDSRLYQVKRFFDAPITSTIRANVWVAVGSTGEMGDIWYSLDDGFSWERACMCLGVGPILSLDLLTIGDTRMWYWGCKGQVYRSLDLEDKDWTQINLPGDDSVVSMAKDYGSVVTMAGQGSIYTSKDGLFVTGYVKPGYSFDVIARIGNDGGSQWMAFARSNLTQYTYWISTDLEDWIPSNNGFHVSAYALYPEEQPE